MGTHPAKDRNFIGFRISDADLDALTALVTAEKSTRQDVAARLLHDALDRGRDSDHAKPARKSRSVRADDAALFE